MKPKKKVRNRNQKTIRTRPLQKLRRSSKSQGRGRRRFPSSFCEGKRKSSDGKGRSLFSLRKIRRFQERKAKAHGGWSLRRGRVNLQTHKGELDLQGFHLETSLKKQQGSVRLQFNEGYLKVSEGEGDLSWTTDRGETDLRDWKGDLKGESVSGKISGKNLRPKTARLFSKKGTLALRFASRPLLDINSASGTIRAPRYMNKKRAGRALAVSGRLRGTGPREGEVFIKTESGTVFVR